MTMNDNPRTCLDCIHSMRRSQLNPDDVSCDIMMHGGYVNLYEKHKQCRYYKFCEGHREALDALHRKNYEEM